MFRPDKSKFASRRKEKDHNGTGFLAGSPTAGKTSLPHYLQCELNVSRQRDQALQTSCACGRSVALEYLGVTGAIKGQGRRKVCVIEDIEKLGSELHVEALRNLLHREDLNQ